MDWFPAGGAHRSRQSPIQAVVGQMGGRTSATACLHFVLLGAVGLFPGAAVCTTSSTAVDEARDINLAAGSLQGALDRLARAAQLQIMYDAALLRGYTTPGLKGFMTPVQALEQLLANTNVAYKFTVDDAVALYRKAQPRGAAPAPPPTPTPTPTITITSERSAQDQHTAGATLSPLKTDSADRAIPASIQSLTSQSLRDQQAGRLEDILEYVSSVETAPDGQSAVGFNIRGFPTYQYYVDGVRVSPDLHRDGFRDLTNVERVDVIKGPASTLYGRTGPGGLINVNTKQPLPDASLAVGQQFGSFDHRRTQLDAGGPVFAGGSIRYRFNAAYDSGGSFRELYGNHRILVSPVVTWTISPGTEATAYLELLRSDDPLDSGLPLIGSSLAPVPVRRRVEDGGLVRTKDLRTGLRGSHTFSDQWKASYHLDGRWLRTPQSPQRALSDQGLDSATCSQSHCPVHRVLFAVPVSGGHTYFGSAELAGAWSQWGLHHSLLVGTEYFDVRGENTLLFSNDADTIDLFAPRHRKIPASFLLNPDGAFSTTSTEQWNGVYLHDHIAITERWSLIMGARYDHVREFLRSALGIPLIESGTQTRWDSAFKRRAGVVWQPPGFASLYANYTENFGISTGLYGDGSGGAGTLLPPQSAHEWEVGLKAQLPDGAAGGSIAWYNLTEINITQPTRNRLSYAQGFRTVTGAARSQGLELQVHGDLNTTLRLSANYAYTDATVANDKRLWGAARHGGSLWLTYRASAGLASGMKLGLGMVARSQREGDNANDYLLPGFTRMKALAAYSWPAFGMRLNVQLNVDNIFDTRYFESVSETHSVMPGCPRRWLLAMGADL